MWKSGSKLISRHFKNSESVLNVIKRNAVYPVKVWNRVVLPEVSESLNERLSEMNKVDTTIHFKVDIGLPPPEKVDEKTLQKRKQYLVKRRNDLEIQKKSRMLELTPDLEEIRKDWLSAKGPNHIQQIADHYGVFDHLFGEAYFTPYVIMDIRYPGKDKELGAPVCWGNIVKPAEANSQPIVTFESQPDDLWTLTLVSPDGNLTEDNMEYIHWLVGNIPGGDVTKGETIWDYLPPFPPRGVGAQRFIFVLYKQDKRIDYSKLKKKSPCLELKERNFKTLEFYRERQDDMTPAGLSFFQSDWDKSTKKFYHEVLNMEEPVFEYDHEPLPLKKQRIFPKKEPFNLYLDRYRDQKDVAKEYLLKKLKDVNPLDPPKKAFPYPEAVQLKYKGMPTWLKTKEVRYDKGVGRIQNHHQVEYEVNK